MNSNSRVLEVGRKLSAHVKGWKQVRVVEAQGTGRPGKGSILQHLLGHAQLCEPYLKRNGKY